MMAELKSWVGLVLALAALSGIFAMVLAVLAKLLEGLRFLDLWLICAAFWSSLAVLGVLLDNHKEKERRRGRGR